MANFEGRLSVQEYTNFICARAECFYASVTKPRRENAMTMTNEEIDIKRVNP